MSFQTREGPSYVITSPGLPHSVWLGLSHLSTGGMKWHFCEDFFLILLSRLAYRPYALSRSTRTFLFTRKSPISPARTTPFFFPAPLRFNGTQRSWSTCITKAVAIAKAKLFTEIETSFAASVLYESVLREWELTKPTELGSFVFGFRQVLQSRFGIRLPTGLLRRTFRRRFNLNWRTSSTSNKKDASFARTEMLVWCRVPVPPWANANEIRDDHSSISPGLDIQD